MTMILIFGFLGFVFLCVIIWEVWTWWKARIKAFFLGGVYRLQARLELRNKSKISGFLLNRAYTAKVLRDYNELQIKTQIKAIKSRETPVTLEGMPRTTSWNVDYRRGIAETVICTDVEIVD